METTTAAPESNSADEPEETVAPEPVEEIKTPQVKDITQKGITRFFLRLLVWIFSLVLIAAVALYLLWPVVGDKVTEFINDKFPGITLVEPVQTPVRAPKPQEIAYVTWVVYDNDNDAKFEGGPRPYGNYEPGVYTPYTTEGKFLPKDPGRFYSPRNFDRSENIPLSYLEDLVANEKMTQEQLDSLRNNYLSENELESIFGGYGQQYGPYANGYMQYGGIKVNWSLFDESKSGNEPWWQIFRPGQAYKFLAIIRYARGSEGKDSADNYLFGPSNGGEGETGTVFGAPRRAGSQTYFPNLYFTDDFKDGQLCCFQRYRDG